MLCVRGLCLPLHLDVLMMWAEEQGIYCFNLQDTCVWSREGTLAPQQCRFWEHWQQAGIMCPSACTEDAA